MGVYVAGLPTGAYCVPPGRLTNGRVRIGSAAGGRMERRTLWPATRDEPVTIHDAAGNHRD